MKNVEGIRVRWADAEPSQRYETSIDGGPWQPTTLRAVKKIRAQEPVTYVERA